MKLHRQLFLSLLLFTALSPNLSAQRNDLLFPPGQQKVEIPFDYQNNFIIVSLVFNEIFPLRFIFDTGAENTILIQREITDLLQVDYQKRFTIQGADLGTPLFAYLARGIHLRIGEMHAYDRSILVLEEDYFHFDQFSGIDVHGILGADFFRRFVVKINYQKQVITLQDPVSFKPPKGGRFFEYPMEVHRNKPYIHVETLLTNDTTVNTKLLMDTGASIPLLLYTATNPLLRMPAKVIESNIGIGLGGIIYGYLGRIKQLKLQKHPYEEILTNFQELPPVIDTSFLHGRNGIIGNQLLERFVILIDYIHEKLYLQPDVGYKNDFIFDRSGLILAASGDNLNKFTVFDLVRNGPAERAGIMRGDEIRTVNGLPSRFFKLEDLNQKFRQKLGKKIKLVIYRNEVRMEKEFVLELII
jgi:hypothetical protein